MSTIENLQIRDYYITIIIWMKLSGGCYERLDA